MPDEACAHLAVTRKTDRTPDGETSGAWECEVCGQELVPEVWVKEAAGDDYRAGLEAGIKELETHPSVQGTHYDGCEKNHWACRAIGKLRALAEGEGTELNPPSG